MKVQSLLFIFCLSSYSMGQGQTLSPAELNKAKTALETLANRYQKIGPVRFSIWHGAQSRPDGAFYTDGQVDVAWDGKSKFRVEQMDMWGSGALWVSDGKTVLRESLAWDGTVSLSNASEKTPLGDGAFSPGSPAGSLIFSFLQGLPAVEAQLKTPSQLQPLPDRDGLQAIQVDTRRQGLVTIIYSSKDWLIRRFEFPSAPSMEMRSDGINPQANARSRQEITMLQIGGRFDPFLFDTTVPEEMDVDDQRKP